MGRRVGDQLPLRCSLLFHCLPHTLVVSVFWGDIVHSRQLRVFGDFVQVSGSPIKIPFFDHLKYDFYSVDGISEEGVSQFSIESHSVANTGHYVCPTPGGLYLCNPTRLPSFPNDGSRRQIGSGSAQALRYFVAINNTHDHICVIVCYDLKRQDRAMFTMEQRHQQPLHPASLGAKCLARTTGTVHVTSRTCYKMNRNLATGQS